MILFLLQKQYGRASPDEGYEKADIFDENGEVIQGYGGRKLPD